MKNDQPKRLIEHIGDQYVSLAADPVEAFTAIQERKARGRVKLWTASAACFLFSVLVAVVLLSGVLNQTDSPAIPDDPTPPADQPGADQPGANEPGTEEPGTDEPDDTQPTYPEPEITLPDPLMFVQHMQSYWTSADWGEMNYIFNFQLDGRVYIMNLDTHTGEIGRYSMTNDDTIKLWTLTEGIGWETSDITLLLKQAVSPHQTALIVSKGDQTQTYVRIEPQDEHLTLRNYNTTPSEAKAVYPYHIGQATCDSPTIIFDLPGVEYFKQIEVFQFTNFPDQLSFASVPSVQYKIYNRNLDLIIEGECITMRNFGECVMEVPKEDGLYYLEVIANPASSTSIFAMLFDSLEVHYYAAIQVGEPEPDEPVTPPDEPGTDEPIGPEEPTDSLLPDYIPERDFGGQTIEFLDWEHGSVSPNNPWMPWDALGFDGLSGTSSLDRAIYERNTAVEHGYNVDLVRTYYPLAATPYEIYTLAGDTLCDVLITRPASIERFLYGGTNSNYVGWELSVTDLAQYSSILSLDQPWWNPAALEAGRAGDHIYFATPALLIQENLAMGATFYNAEIAWEHDLDLYHTVTEGNWTLEEMIRIGELVATSLDGDDQINSADDLWGGMLSTDTIYDLLSDAGAEPVVMTADGKLKYRYNSNFIEAFNYITTSLYGNQNFASPYQQGRPTMNATEMFRDGKAMFLLDTVSKAAELIQYSTWGLLPTPKVDPLAADYTSLVSIYRTQSLIVPAQTAADKEAIMTVLEALSYISYQTVDPLVCATLLPGASRETQQLINLNRQNRLMFALISESRIYSESRIWTMSVFNPSDYVRHSVGGGESYLARMESALMEAASKFNNKLAD